MKGWLIAALIVLACAAQTSLFLPWSLWGIRPDLVVITVCAIGLSKGPFTGGVAGFSAGLLVDVLGGRLIGLGALSKGAAGVISGWMSRRLFRENALVPVLIALGVSLGEGVFYLLGAHAFGVPFPWIEGFFRIVLPEAWYNALVAAVLFPGLFRLLRYVDALSVARRPGPVES